MKILTSGLAVACICAAPLAANAQNVIVQTQQGLVQGVATASGTYWLGIPYAAPPTGALRWYPPQPAAPYSGIRPANAASSSCPQPVSPFGQSSLNEDCLYLNVYAPQSATRTSNLPVMVWIHGGAFVTGEGSDYDSLPLATQGNVVVVTINYRLGLLGFMAHPALTAGDPVGSSGNYGLLDQEYAMHWVRRNIAGFGGDPGSMTIFGESAGGASVQFQLTAPGTPKLHSAIIESGVYMSALPTLAQSEATGVTIATKTLNCSGTTAAAAACLRNASVAGIVGAVDPLTGGVSPNVDGTTLPHQPLQAFNRGQFQHVPIINGSNHDEYRLFVALNDIFGSGPLTATDYVNQASAAFGAAAYYVLSTYPLSAYPNPGYAYAALVTDYSFACGAHLLDGLAAQYSPVYAYELNDPQAPDLFLPADGNLLDLGNSHAAELPYIFPQLDDPLLGIGPFAFSTGQQFLASSIRAFWTSLARYGRPLAPRATFWQPYTSQSAVLSLVPPAPATEYGFVADHKCNFWKPLLLQNAGLPQNVPY